MIKNIRIDSLVKSAALTIAISAMGLSLTACGDKTASTSSSASGERSSYEKAFDHALGDPKAPITVIEYASVTCVHCATWNESVWHDFNEKYVETGKVRYVFREIPTAPHQLATAGHLLANCAPEEKYFDLLHIQFKRQRQIMSSTDVKGEYVALAKSAGMSEEDFNTCMRNEDEKQRLADVVALGDAHGVTGTPSFVINGKKEKAFLLEDFDKIFAKILGEPLPEKEAAKEDEAEKSAASGEH